MEVASHPPRRASAVPAGAENGLRVCLIRSMKLPDTPAPTTHHSPPSTTHPSHTTQHQPLTSRQPASTTTHHRPSTPHLTARTTNQTLSDMLRDEKTLAVHLWLKIPLAPETRPCIPRWPRERRRTLKLSWMSRMSTYVCWRCCRRRQWNRPQSASRKPHR